MTREHNIALAIAAGFYFQELPEYAPLKHTVDYEYSEACFHRLVESVVRECAAVVRKNYLNEESIDYMEEALFEHFNIEEK